MRGPPGGPSNVDLKAQIAREEARIAFMTKDSYAQRKMEGRPNHTLLSWSAILVMLVSAMLQAGSAALPSWRTNFVGIIGYPRTRTWGLIAISSAVKWQTYDQQRNYACLGMGEVHVLSTCITPLCLWYRQKCITYMYMEYLMISMAVVLGICFLINVLCVLWLFRLTPTTIQYCSYWSVTMTIFYLLLVIGGQFLWDELFDDFMAFSFYPNPYFGAGFYTACFSGAVLLTGSILCCLLASTWPIPDEESDCEDGETDDDAETRVAKKRLREQQETLKRQQAPPQGRPKAAMAGGPFMAPHPMGAPQGGPFMAPHPMGAPQGRR